MSEQDRVDMWNSGHPERHMEVRQWRYSLYLEDGEFEYWNQVLGFTKNDEIYQKLFKEWQKETKYFRSLNIPPDTYLYARYYHKQYWIRQRFNEFFSPEWRELNKYADFSFERLANFEEECSVWKPLKILISEYLENKT